MLAHTALATFSSCLPFFLRRVPSCGACPFLRTKSPIPLRTCLTVRLAPLQAARLAPAIVHFDGTARLQTLAAEDDPWMHSLLLAVGNNKG
mmetsp:Transcript_6298/g.14849  ORF Transcript_6298/g.14849 Transcript_6298/m.14849 type:complete len:91 (+) Transcript_6298:1588-1860(+)